MLEYEFVKAYSKVLPCCTDRKSIGQNDRSLVVASGGLGASAARPPPTAAETAADRRGPPRTAANHCKPVGGTLKSLWLLAVQIAFARFFASAAPRHTARAM